MSWGRMVHPTNTTCYSSILDQFLTELGCLSQRELVQDIGTWDWHGQLQVRSQQSRQSGSASQSGGRDEGVPRFIRSTHQLGHLLHTTHKSNVTSTRPSNQTEVRQANGGPGERRLLLCARRYLANVESDI